MSNHHFLVLEDGTIFCGTGFGAEAPAAGDLVTGLSGSGGEIVFNTGMSGYVEIATDPSYAGQLVVFTYPHIGNYGVDERWMESGRGPSGFIIRSLYTGKVPEGRKSLHTFLKNRSTTGITGIDTRALTLKLRDEGSCNGVIIRGNDIPGKLPPGEKEKVLQFLHDFPSMEGRNLVRETGAKETETINESGFPHIAVIDCGIKTSIIKNLAARGCRITVMPSNVSSDTILDLHCDGVLVSNGPGDPATLTTMIEQIKNLIGTIPLAGICLGHQIIGLALGAKTVKMKFGHHGINHPVKNIETNKIIITSQNHGFMIDEASLPNDVTVWMRNSNDNSVEGIKQKNTAIITTQFHPESAPGPHDALWIFDEIIKSVYPVFPREEN